MNLDLDVMSLLDKSLPDNEKEAAIYSRVLLLEDEYVEATHLVKGSLEALSVIFTSLLNKEELVRASIFVGVLNYLEHSDPNEETKYFLDWVEKKKFIEKHTKQ